MTLLASPELPAKTLSRPAGPSRKVHERLKCANRLGGAWIFSFLGSFYANRSLTLGRRRLYTAAFSKFDTNPSHYHFF